MDVSKRDTKSIGDLSEVMAIAALTKAGYAIAVPLGENHRYDLVIDDGCALWRVQVKTGRLRKGAVLFNCYSSHQHRNGPSCRSYSGEIDYFAVYSPELETTYLVPIKDLAALCGALRVASPRNGQKKSVRWAERYALRGVRVQEKASTTGLA